MTPAVETALEQRSMRLAGLLRLTLHDRVVRLCDGGTTRWGDEQFVARDPVYGTIGDFEAVTEGIGDTIPALEFSLVPPSFAAARALCDMRNDGAAFRLWMAVIDEETGMVIPDPEMQFAGEIDVPTLEVDEDNSFSVRISIASVFEQLFEPDEGVRLADSFHQYVFPRELGMANITGTPISTIWGPGEKNGGVTNVSQ